MNYYNPNPHNRHVGDCVIRAITKATGEDWDHVYCTLCAYGYDLKNWGNGNEVWHTYLRRRGYKRRLLPDECPECYTVGDFAKDHPHGTYIVSASGHVVCVADGEIFDTWDSSHEIALDYWEQKGS